MLRVLDPHSNFYDPKAYARMREEQHGRYYGVGMVIQQQNDGKVYVIHADEGTPSFRAGIHPGDVSSTRWTARAPTGMDLGPGGQGAQGTQGHARAGDDDFARASQSRWSSIWCATRFPTPPWTLKYEIRPGVGYIHLTQFQETTAQEVDDAIDSFGDLKGLVLDLRGNPGGLLSQAVDVCDHLLSKGQTSSRSAGAPIPTRTTRPPTATAARPFPSWCWSTAIRLRRLRLSPARCRITTAR
jgi:carboxyl-terminal processing protease